MNHQNESSVRELLSVWTQLAHKGRRLPCSTLQHKSHSPGLRGCCANWGTHAAVPFHTLQHKPYSPWLRRCVCTTSHMASSLDRWSSAFSMHRSSSSSSAGMQAVLARGGEPSRGDFDIGLRHRLRRSTAASPSHISLLYSRCSEVIAEAAGGVQCAV